MSNKIHQGTGRLTGTPLCDSCTHFMERGNQRECNYSYSKPLILKSAIYNCSVYYNKSMTSVRDMYDIAWELKTDKKKGSVGFQPPNKRDVDD